MCEICALTTTFDPARHTPGQSLSEAMRVVEGSDAAADRFTAYEIGPGDTFEGTLSYAGDRDWVAVTLEAGTSYDIAIDAYWGGGGSLRDSYLRIYDDNGSLRALNDDGGSNPDSALTFTATTSGTYFISVGSFSDSLAGSYTVEIDENSTTPVPPPVVTGTDATLDQLADYLTDGYWNDTSRSGRRFDTSSDNEITVDITDLTAEGQRLARWAMEAWEMVADIEFSEVSSSSADITFDDEDSGAFSSSNTSGGTLTSSEVNVSHAWLEYYGTDVYSYSLQTYIHEIGHALGLGHQGNYNGNATYDSADAFRNDSWQVSIMSYFSQSENTSTTASEARVITTMMADILAIQNLYGAADSNSATGGNTIWGQGTNLGGYLGDILEDGASESVAFTINDASGTDIINLTNYRQNNLLNLNEESFSNVAGLIGNVGIARGTVIENASLGAGDDTVLGNGADNDIRGALGSDSLEGGAGDDRLRGGGDADTVRGDDGADTILGDSGNDRLIGGNGNDALYGWTGDDALYGGVGSDRLYGDDGDDRLRGDADNDTLIGGYGTDTLLGDSGDDYLSGSSGYDSLSGGDGDDRIRGGNHDDTVNGDDGSDTLLGDTGNDVLDGGSGNDALYGWTGDDTLRGGHSNDRLFGNADDDLLDGGNGNDTLYGGTGQDDMYGGSGNDRMRGGSNADTLRGGDGSDTLLGDSGDDRLIGNDGDDALYGWSGDDALYGGDGDDRIFGDAGDDRIRGDGGDDRILGGSGEDTLLGDSGNDTLTGNDGADVFYFNADLTEGSDTITDFTSHLDVIEIANTTFADLSFARQGDATRVSWDNGSVLLEDVVSFGDDDFIFT